MRQGRLIAALVAAVLGAMVLPPGAAGAAGAAKVKSTSPTAKRCGPGTYPVLVKGARKIKPRRDRRGRLRCATTKAGSRPVAPGLTASQQLGRVADGLDRALAAVPTARRAMDRRLGARRTSALVDLGLDGWRRSAGAAGWRARAADSTTTTFGSEKDGTAGTATLDVTPIDGDKLGLKASADVEVSVTREAIEKIAKEKVPSDVKSVKVKVSVSFEDAPQACPSAAGELRGRLHGKASITLTATGADGKVTEMRLSADADMTYKVKVGDDGRWTSVDDVEMRTEFQGSGTGQSTSTFRGYSKGSGFGREGILSGAGSFSDRLTRDWGHVTPQSVSGPKGTWRANELVSLQDLRSVDNVKSMIATWIATDALTLSGVEYLRGVALPRGEKHWYDDEACLTLKGEASPAKVPPRGTSTVTASEAKAKDGGAVPAQLTATGTASIDPGAAALAQGGKQDFKLTAPDRGSAMWNVVAISRAGKKTVSGAVPVVDDVPAAFSGTVTSTSDAGLGAAHQEFTSQVRYELASRTDGPDGSITATYDLKSAPTQVTDDQNSSACGTYRFSGSGGVIAYGDLELYVAADGTATYFFVVDVGFAGAAYVHVGPLPKGCPGPSTGLVKAFLNSRTAGSAARPAPADRHLVQTTTSDLLANQPGLFDVSAAWDLQPLAAG